MPNNHNGFEKILWKAADKFRANSKLKPLEYSVPVLGLIFLTLCRFPFRTSGEGVTAKGSRLAPQPD